MKEVLERALMSERTEIEAAFARGIAIGLAQVDASGEACFKVEALKRMLERGIPEDKAKTILEM